MRKGRPVSMWSTYTFHVRVNDTLRLVQIRKTFSNSSELGIRQNVVVDSMH